MSTNITSTFLPLAGFILQNGRKNLVRQGKLFRVLSVAYFRQRSQDNIPGQNRLLSNIFSFIFPYEITRYFMIFHYGVGATFIHRQIWLKFTQKV
jgi:hypothetical protein